VARGRASCIAGHQKKYEFDQRKELKNVIVVVAALFVFGGRLLNGNKKVDINISTPAKQIAGFRQASI